MARDPRTNPFGIDINSPYFKTNLLIAVRQKISKDYTLRKALNWLRGWNLQEENRQKELERLALMPSKLTKADKPIIAYGCEPS